MKIKVGTISKEQIFQSNKQRSVIRSQSGAGPHGSQKYSRTKKKKNDNKEIENYRREE